MKASPTITKLAAALIEAKKGFSPVLRDAKNPHFGNRYASLEAVLEAVEKPLLDNGLLLLQPTDITEAGQVSLTYLLHVSGEWLESSYLLQPTKNDPQGMGSALTYGRRYQALAVLGLAPEDDDGNDASTRDNPPTEHRERREPERPVAPPRDFAAEANNAKSLEELRALQRAAAAAGEWVANSPVVNAVLARKQAIEAQEKTEGQQLPAEPQPAQ